MAPEWIYVGHFNEKKKPGDAKGQIEDDTVYVVLTRDNWRKLQQVMDETGTREAFRASGVTMAPVRERACFNTEDFVLLTDIGTKFQVGAYLMEQIKANEHDRLTENEEAE